MSKHLTMIVGSLVLICAIVIVLVSFTSYSSELSFEKGVVEPDVLFSDGNETGTTTMIRTQECLTRENIPSVVRDGALYINEKDMDKAIFVCT